jgi:hypothetical protein
MPQVICPRCEGTKEIQCPSCTGQGERFGQRCLRCIGRCEIICPRCKGRGAVVNRYSCAASAPKNQTNKILVPDRVRVDLICPRCGRSGEATISENANPKVGHPDFVMHAISTEFNVIDASVHCNRIMIRCTCKEVFSVVRRPNSAT